jgi:tetratricopeptide (TPR) repeat protein
VAKLHLLADIEGVQGQNELGQWLHNKADEYCQRGLLKGSNVALHIAIAIWRDTLQEFSREHSPYNWATTQTNLGNALQRLGERESGSERLEQAVTAYRLALEEFTEERTPYYHAKAQENLAKALALIAARQAAPPAS